MHRSFIQWHQVEALQLHCITLEEYNSSTTCGVCNISHDVKLCQRNSYMCLNVMVDEPFPSCRPNKHPPRGPLVGSQSLIVPISAKLLEGLSHEKIYWLGDAYLSRCDWLRSGSQHRASQPIAAWQVSCLSFPLYSHIHAFISHPRLPSDTFILYSVTCAWIHVHGSDADVQSSLSSCISEPSSSVIQATSGQHRNVQSSF